MPVESELINKIKEMERPIKIMHICGTHERTISHYGLRELLPSEIEILSGPGCPVCVTPDKEIDCAIALAKSNVILTSFGDMMRVPGSDTNLMQTRSMGADVRTVYSIDDAMEIAEKNPEKNVVFFAIGFETTAPTNAAAILRNPPENFSVLFSHRIVPPALYELVNEINIDAFIAPGHVCTITGIHIFDNLAKMGFPIVVAGFEARDILLSIYMIIKQMDAKKSVVENAYLRAVRNEGNVVAQKMMKEVFEKKDAEWRGLGIIKNSGLCLKDKFKKYDASVIYKKIIDEYISTISYDNQIIDHCKCAEILKGRIKPTSCQLFDKECTPMTPIGSCMVSQEGMCYNWYRYRSV